MLLFDICVPLFNDQLFISSLGSKIAVTAVSSLFADYSAEVPASWSEGISQELEAIAGYAKIE